MTTSIRATGAGTSAIERVITGTAPIVVRREGGIEPAPDVAARELDVEVARLLRVRGGELAEPPRWERPSHRAAVESIVDQLAPIRSRAALLSSWARESHRDSKVRLAYAITWLRLAQRRVRGFGAAGPRRRLHRPSPPSMGPAAR